MQVTKYKMQKIGTYDISHFIHQHSKPIFGTFALRGGYTDCNGT